MAYSVTILTRQQAAYPLIERFTLEPRRFSWNARGGPERCDIDVSGDPDLMPLMLDWLRCPVVLADEAGNPVWWGYVGSLTYGTAAVQATSNIEGVANRVAAIYRTTQEDCIAGGISTKTEWADNLVSQGLYGIKELLHPIGTATEETAEATRDHVLDMLEQPTSDMRVSGAGAGVGTLTCQGWYETLGWLYYTKLTTYPMETSNQIADVLDLTGQFFAGSMVRERSNHYEPEYSEGTITGLVKLEELLDKGVKDGRRYLVTVDRNLNILVYEEPLATNRLAQVALDARGRFVNATTNAPLPMGTCPAGMWLDWLGSVQQTSALNFVSKPVPIFIERCEIDCASDVPNWTPRGQPDPWKSTQVLDG